MACGKSIGHVTDEAYYFENLQQLDIMLNATECVVVSRKLKLMRITLKTVLDLK